ncbi:hypothetical protein ABK040_004154 [Willaertia magna]
MIQDSSNNNFKLKLLGHRGSQPSRAVELTLKLLNLNYDYQEINFLNGETRTKEFKEKFNPNGLIPTLIINDNTLQNTQNTLQKDDNSLQKNDNTLDESHTIMRYLCKLQQNNIPNIEMSNQLYLCNNNYLQCSKIDQYLDWHHLNIRLFTLQIAHGFLFLEFSKDLPKNLILELIEMKIKENHLRLQNGLQRIENYYLKNKNYLINEKFTIADISLGCELYHLYCYGYPFLELGFTKIVKWLNLLEENIFYFKEIHKELIKDGEVFKMKFKNYMDQILLDKSSKL